MPESSTTSPAKPARHGVLALVCTGLKLPLQVLHSAAGYYIGTQNDEGPISRESVEYFPFHAAAQLALATNAWTQRDHS